MSRSSKPFLSEGVPKWHALAVPEVLTALDVNEHLGLGADEVEHRLQQHGENRLPDKQRRPAWLRFLSQFHNALIYVLIAAGLTTLALGSFIDAFVILCVVLVNALIGHIQEGKAEQALEAVHDMLAARATVLRSGERHQIEAARLVPGDIVLLEPGDKIPADLRLTRVKNLRVVESALTGESAPVEKSIAPVAAEMGIADRSCMCFSGTLVSAGQAQGVVVCTGQSTEIGRIGTLVGDIQGLVTPLMRRLDQFARQITWFILGLALLTMGYGHFVARMDALELFLAVVGLAVAAIPEGMPAVVTIVLAIGTRVMARHKAIVRRLPAVETLGSVTVICTDKTGTLTKNEMTAVRLVLPQAELSVSGTGYEPEGGVFLGDQSIDPLEMPALQALARAALLCNDAQLKLLPEQGWTLLGDPTEGALMVMAHKVGLEQQATEVQFPRLDTVPFESERQLMATLHHDHEGRHFALIKGAPEKILALCSTQAGDQPLDPESWHIAVRRAASAGERVLAVAQCDWPADCQSINLQDITRRFELLGLVGMIDPPREEAIAAVADCQAAGIRVKMITGDHAVTAAAIGAQLGLAAGKTLTGEEIERMDDASLQEHAAHTDVFARASPEHKLRLIAALQSRGQLVAMTGDGVNDAPALKSADIGVAMGHKGTDVAREASDLVLTDDNFATIARAVREGRVVYDNIKKSLMHMLPTNGGEAGVILLAIFAGLPLPVTAGQILWVNTVTSVTLALSLAFEPAEQGVMAQAPRPASESIITRALGHRILFVILLMVCATFAVFNWELNRGSSLELARTAAVNMIVTCELFYLFNVRHFTEHAFKRETLTGNPVALWVAGILVGLQLLFTYAPPMQQLFKSVPLDGSSWAVILGFGLLLFVLVEAEKAVLRRARVHRI